MHCVWCALCASLCMCIRIIKQLALSQVLVGILHPPNCLLNPTRVLSLFVVFCCFVCAVHRISFLKTCKISHLAALIVHCLGLRLRLRLGSCLRYCGLDLHLQCLGSFFGPPHAKPHRSSFDVLLSVLAGCSSTRKSPAVTLSCACRDPAGPSGSGLSPS